jgi:predicted Zn-dependent peptidase
MHNSLTWKRNVLSNGLTVLQYPRSSSTMAQLSVAIAYGSNDDSEENGGTAHFLEHMLVGGSQNRIKLHNEIERLGGQSNFETSDEFTFSTVNVFPQKIAQASKVLSGLLFDPTFTQEKLELERKVILNEIAEAYDDPRERVAETLVKSLFKKHPSRNPVSGSKKTVNRLTLDEIGKAHENYYVPQRMILILTGSFTDKDAETILQDFQDRENSGSIQRRNTLINEVEPKTETVLKKSGITQAYLSFGFRTVPAKDKDTPTLDLIDAILGMGESSRLFVELREKRALTYDFESTNASGLDYGYFSIDCAVNVKALNKTKSIILNELQKLKTQPITKSELDKSKNLASGTIYRQIDSSQGLPRLLAYDEIHFKSENALGDFLSKINSISPQDIMKTANGYFQDENYATVILLPTRQHRVS